MIHGYTTAMPSPQPSPSGRYREREKREAVGTVAACSIIALTEKAFTTAVGSMSVDITQST